MTCYPAPGDLHVELHCVHAQYGVAHVAQQVAGGDDSSEGRELTELLELLFPPAGERRGQYKEWNQVEMLC